MTNENIVVDGETTENTNEDLASQENGEETPNQDEQSRDDEHRRQLHARAVKAEEKAKVLEAKLIAYQKDKERGEDVKTNQEKSPYDLAKELSALRDFNEQEIDIIQRYAKTWDLSLSEAAKNDDVQVLIKNAREKEKLQSNIPAPTNRQGGSAKPDYDSWTSKDLENATIEQAVEYRNYHLKR